MITQAAHKNTKIEPLQNVDTVVQLISIRGFWHLEKIAKIVDTPTTLKGYTKHQQTGP